MKTFTMDVAGRELKATIGKVAAQANGAVFLQYGETTLLCTATASDKPRDGIDFFPLSVEYEEKFYLHSSTCTYFKYGLLFFLRKIRRR